MAIEQVGGLDVGPPIVVLNWEAAPGKKLFWHTPSGSLSALYLTEIRWDQTGTVLVTALLFAHQTNLCAVRSLLPSEALFGRSARDAAQAEKLSSKQGNPVYTLAHGSNMGAFKQLREACTRFPNFPRQQRRGAPTIKIFPEVFGTPGGGPCKPCCTAPASAIGLSSDLAEC